jgi:hypothetical protein
MRTTGSLEMGSVVGPEAPSLATEVVVRRILGRSRLNYV